MMNVLLNSIAYFVTAKSPVKINVSCLIIIFLVGISSASGQNFNWPDGKKAAIVLTYDDGLDSHLDIAIPQLDAFNFKGTFFLYGFLSENSFVDWKKSSESGHELGNHSLFHPCKLKNGSAGKSPLFSSENYDVPSMLREIVMMNKLLFAISGEMATSYAYPCSETVVGGIDYTESLKDLSLFKYARIGGDRTINTDFSNLNFLKVSGYSVKAGSNAATIISYTEDVLKQEGLGIYIFHGIGGDYLSVDAEIHQELLEFLAANEDEFWVTTFSEAMEYIQNTTTK